MINYTHHKTEDELLPSFQRFHRWSLEMAKLFRPTLYWACDYLSMQELKIIHVSKIGASYACFHIQIGHRDFLLTAGASFIKKRLINPAKDLGIHG